MGGCFPCTGEPKTDDKDPPDLPTDKSKSNLSWDVKKGTLMNDKNELSSSGSGCIAAQTFTFGELAAATKNFRADCLLGEGGFGRVYKGRLESSNQIVAIKQLDRNGLQGNREFLVEVLMLSLLHHPNLVNLIGYCADGDQRLLVYEYMPLGSLEDHLHDLSPDKKRLDWNTRMKIAAGAAKGLEYLHDKASPPVIYRDLKCSNILLDEGYHPKLSDFGLAKLGPVGDNTHVSTRVMGTYGYCAPEYAMTGQLTLKSDIYSFGVVLLELITGRRAIDNSRAAGEHNLVAWARPLFKDRRKFSQVADPVLQGANGWPCSIQDQVNFGELDSFVVNLANCVAQVPSYTCLALEFSKWACSGENRNSLLKLYRHESAQLAHYEQQCHMTASRQLVASSVGIGVLSGINGMKATSCCLTAFSGDLYTRKAVHLLPEGSAFFLKLHFALFVLHVFDQTVSVLALLLSTIEE
ncbi:hypothetical protein OPV22_020472 [Ensete ventricosum]|uniref:non-specific serine/threonine protein kinase n=1 Tax=Ensete ventricosum TaxID=4639 RepID=A0AAV8QGH5_ENSVE|nr:hypothetical protein OPV22_020472 [Ensete ventricosum]